MSIVTGTVLVLVTWAVCVVALMSLGLVPALLITPPVASARADAAAILRRAMWWGLLIVTLFAYLVNLRQPLHSGSTALAGMALLALLGGPGWWVLRRRQARFPAAQHGWVFTALWITLGLSLVYVAIAALGPVTNYDSGLYHLGAIKYAADYPAIPGLANLYFPFGYGNAEFPLAALLGNGPWQSEGFRLLNGLVMTLAVVDLGLRSHHRRLGPGFFVLLAGILAAWVPMVALSDYWVTSPTQDSSVFIITIVATAYLAQAAVGGTSWLAEGATAAGFGLLLVLLRPTMIAFAAAAIAAVIVLAWHRRAHLRTERLSWSVGVVATTAAVAAGAAIARDWVLSGWLQYPLSIHAFDVPWLAPDPAQYRIATLGFHRNPADWQHALDGWAWVGPWLVDRVSQWETYEFAGLMLVAATLAVLANRVARPMARWRALLLALAPSLVATAVWWAATPPSYRFAWGPLFSMATVIIGWSLWLLTSQDVAQRPWAGAWLSWSLAAATLPILVVSAYSAVGRLDIASITAAREWRMGVAIPYVVTPVIDVPVKHLTTDSGLALLQPTTSDQCWDHYPLCTPQPDMGLHLRGQDVADGFLP